MDNPSVKIKDFDWPRQREAGLCIFLRDDEGIVPYFFYLSRRHKTNYNINFDVRLVPSGSPDHKVLIVF